MTLITVHYLALLLFPSSCRVLVSDRGLRVALCFCPFLRDSVRRRHRRSHHLHFLPPLLLLFRVRDHDRGSDRVCHAHPPHVHAQAEHPTSRCDCDCDYWCRSIGLQCGGVCYLKTHASQAFFLSVLAGKEKVFQNVRGHVSKLTKDTRLDPA